MSRSIGRIALSLTGWGFEGELPNLSRFVLIVAPHTSNWDFPLGVAGIFALGARVSFLGKHPLFKWPLGIPMRWLGGIPVDRSVRRDRVAESVDAFKENEKLILVVAPEGTRRYVAEWKTGFYYVAHGAGVPIVPVAFDYEQKVIRIGAPFTPTGNPNADIATLKKFYSAVVARKPENFQP